ncbi:MAG: YczE/YyaS/YitT family protein [Ilumatobacteraceae bacterium]
MPADRRIERVVRCVIGLAMCGAGIAMIIHGDLGLAPWDVFHQGVSDRTGIAIGTVIVIVGLCLLAVWIPLRIRPGIGTFLNAALIGLVVDLVDPRLPEPDHLVAQFALMLGGVLAFGVGSGLYIGAGLGPGPRDGLMTGIARRGPSIRVARTAIELVVLMAGFLLGGTVGVGTAVFALGIGPLVHHFLPRFDVDAASSRALAQAQRSV